MYSAWFARLEITHDSDLLSRTSATLAVSSAMPPMTLRVCLLGTAKNVSFSDGQAVNGNTCAQLAAESGQQTVSNPESTITVSKTESSRVLSNGRPSYGHKCNSCCDLLYGTAGLFIVILW